MLNVVENPWSETWDTVIIGAGPAGVAASIYAVRGALKVLVIEKQFVGGQIALTNEVENYPAYPHISGPELARKLEEHLEKFQAPILFKEVKKLKKGEDGTYLVEVATGQNIEAKTIIIATGSSPNRLPAENEEKFYGKGVSYCAICDGPFFKGQPVALVGGGDAAVEEATYLSSICSHVTLIHRRDEFRAQPLYVERLKARSNVSFKMSYVVESILGTDRMEGLLLKNLKNNETEILKVPAVFAFIGHRPNTEFAKGFVEMSDSGEIYVDERMRTNLPGVFAVGDVTYRSLKQMAISCGEGVTAAIVARQYLTDGKWREAD